jgi:hypothetical protein
MLVSPQKKVKLTGLRTSVSERCKLYHPPAGAGVLSYSLVVFEPPILPASRHTSSYLLTSHCVANQALCSANTSLQSPRASLQHRRAGTYAVLTA